MSTLLLLLDPPPIPDSVAPKSTCGEQNKLRGRHKGNYNKECVAANTARRNQSQERYRAVMGQKWMSTTDLMKALRFRRESINGALSDWMKRGEVERRKLPGRLGYEWKWLDR